ncbi:MAG: hypothetical protein LBQ66_03245 [Planctomycetaceae bacterium]|nr:hypothetical protein [Planctomycetaceae bacterium]
MSLIEFYIFLTRKARKDGKCGMRTFGIQFFVLHKSDFICTLPPRPQQKSGTLHTQILRWYNSGELV